MNCQCEVLLFLYIIFVFLFGCAIGFIIGCKWIAKQTGIILQARKEDGQGKIKS